MRKHNVIAEAGTAAEGDNNSERIKFYESSVRHAETDEPLMSVICIGGGDGLRMTKDQTAELVGFLVDWLNDA